MLKLILPRGATERVKRVFSLRNRSRILHLVILVCDSPHLGPALKSVVRWQTKNVQTIFSHKGTVSAIAINVRSQDGTTRSRGHLEFFFQNTRPEQQFVIARILKAVIGDKDFFRELTSKELCNTSQTEREHGIKGRSPSTLKAIRHRPNFQSFQPLPPIEIQEPSVDRGNGVSHLTFLDIYPLTLA